MAGSTAPSGTGIESQTISALCESIPAWFVKFITTVHPPGTVRVSSPSRKPLKLSAPLSGVALAINSKVTVLVSVATRIHFGSICCAATAAGCCAWTGEAPVAPTEAAQSAAATESLRTKTIMDLIDCKERPAESPIIGDPAGHGSREG